jgi:hypothetical protein
VKHTGMKRMNHKQKRIGEGAQRESWQSRPDHGESLCKEWVETIALDVHQDGRMCRCLWCTLCRCFVNEGADCADGDRLG